MKNFNYRVVNGNELAITAYTGDDTIVNIPSEIEGKPVTNIGNSAFSRCTSLTSVTIPNSVTNIGTSAFCVCSSLTSVTIPNSVTSIGNFAFWGCTSLTNVEIPNSVKWIGYVAFRKCTSLTDINVDSNNAEYSSTDGVLFNKDKTKLICYPIGKTNISYTIPNSVTSIGDFAFEGCSSLINVEIPDGATNIDDYAFFWDCTGLIDINVDNNNANYSSIDGVLFNKDKTKLICYPKGKTNTSYTIPDSVTSIGDYAFWGCTGLTSVEIPNSVISIGTSAFRSCSSLTNVEIPNSVTSIGDAAFFRCTGLTSVEIPDSVTSIGFWAFGGCTHLTR